MNRYKIRRDGLRPLEFSGSMVGEVSTRFKRERWTELRLYATAISTLDGAAVDTWGKHTPAAGSYVCEQVGRSTVDGEIDRCKAWVCHTIDDVKAVLGEGPLAQQLYLTAGLDGTESVQPSPSPTTEERTDR
jgi:hypothetical protein